MTQQNKITPDDCLRLDAKSAIHFGRQYFPIDQMVESINLHHAGERRLDAGETVMLARQLLYVKSAMIEISYPMLRAREVLPVDYEVPTGAESFSVVEWDQVGKAKLVTNYADDLPRVDVKAAETIRKIYSFGDSFAWSIQDLRRVAMGQVDLSTKKLRAAREVFERMVETLASVGDATLGLEGLLKASNVPVVALANAGTWATKIGAGNADHVIADVNKLINSIPTTTNAAHSATTVQMDINSHALISTTARSTTTDTTILQFLKANHPGVTFEAWFPCGLANATNNGPRLVAYQKDDIVAGLVIPQDFETFPPQERNLAWVMNCHGRCGGVAVNKPKAIAYMDGI
jgi:hypothetical protein